MKNEFLQKVIKYTFGEVNEELNTKFNEVQNKICCGQVKLLQYVIVN